MVYNHDTENKYYFSDRFSLHFFFSYELSELCCYFYSKLPPSGMIIKTAANSIHQGVNDDENKQLR